MSPVIVGVKAAGMQQITAQSQAIPTRPQYHATWGEEMSADHVIEESK